MLNKHIHLLKCCSTEVSSAGFKGVRSHTVSGTLVFVRGGNSTRGPVKRLIKTEVVDELEEMRAREHKCTRMSLRNTECVFVLYHNA